VQLIAANELVLNKSKPIVSPGNHQILCRIEAVGLCFSDLKLIKQFAAHPRKSEITSGINPDTLNEISSYVPSSKPTVPGHETVVRIEAVGRDVKHFKKGQRYLVETDYRWLPTPESNSAFGYNFEGALQEYVLMDERVITSPNGESMLIPAPENLSASSIALIEPWGCVENAYASDETQHIDADNTMLIAADVIVTPNELTEIFKQWGQPAKVIWASQYRPPEIPGVNMELCPEIARLDDFTFADIIYLGANPNRVEALFSKLGAQGLFNIVLCGERFGRDIAVPIGRIHYSGIRITGTIGYEPADSMKHIPLTSEVRKGDKINIVGAAGPMGTMHVIRNIYRGIEGISVFAGDSDEGRLANLLKTAEPMAIAKGVPYKQYSPIKDKMPEGSDYSVIMAPAPELAAAAVMSAGKRAIINIFAGIPNTMTAKINLDTYIEKQMYFVGTSGSVMEDMKRELAKLESGSLDTNISVAAICGLDGVSDGIRAIENRSIAGKIIAYPSCKGLPLTLLSKLPEKIPDVAACLNNGIWTAQAEQKLLEKFAAIA